MCQRFCFIECPVSRMQQLRGGKGFKGWGRLGMKVWAVQTLGLSRIATRPKKRVAIISQAPAIACLIVLFELNFEMQVCENHEAEESPSRACPQSFCVLKYRK